MMESSVEGPPGDPDVSVTIRSWANQEVGGVMTHNVACARRRPQGGGQDVNLKSVHLVSTKSGGGLEAMTWITMLSFP